MPGGKTDKDKNCQYCGKSFNIRGIVRHEKACKAQSESAARDARYAAALADQRAKQSRHQQDAQVLPSIPGPSQIPQEAPLQSPVFELSEEFDYPEIYDPPPNPSLSSPSQEPELDTIRVDFHPHTKQPSKFFSFEEFGKQSLPDDFQLPPDATPFQPFRTRGDFEFADLALHAHLSKTHIDAFIDLLHKVASGESKFTLKNSNELNATWELASTMRTKWEKATVPVQYDKNETIEYEVWNRPLWDWTLDLLQEEQLKPYFVWDAQRLFKWDGERWIRFYNEPWTGTRWWDIQTVLPPNGKLLGYIIYIDKSQLSSFGTAKAYPVIMRLANLLIPIRNGRGIGGGQIVGWLPVVEEDADKEKKPRFANFKRVVWHSSFWEIIKTIVFYSKLGFSWEIIKEIISLLFPIGLIFCADFEEQVMIALTRGVSSLYPCPICLVPADKLFDLFADYPIRTALSAEALVKQARTLTQEDGNNLLKEQGLRNVENVFWQLQHSDPFAALSWDKLHAHDSGLFADHLLPEIKKHLENLGRQATVTVNNQMSCLPRWRNLNHFNAALSVSFSDATKWEDIAKTLLFACHNVLTAKSDPAGYLLLQCFRRYLNVTMYLGLELHTEDTIAAGETELLEYSNSLQSYIAMDSTDKNWNFPKNHTHKHAFDDIRSKGVTRNYNTKPMEQMHGRLRDIYKRRTNFKNVEQQITTIEHHFLISDVIRQALENWDQYYNADQDQEEAEKEFKRIHLGSKQKPITLSEIQDSHSTDTAFITFRQLLSAFLNNFFAQYNIPLPNGKRILLKPDHKIQEYRFIKVFYESIETWTLKADYLRCNPDFHHHARYDYILVDGGDENFFAKLILIFTITLDDTEYPLAYIQPFDRSTGSIRNKDKDLGFYRIGAQPRNKAEFISIHSIIRGAYIVPDFEKDSEFLVVDTIDGDMFLRLFEMYGDPGSE